MAFKDITGNDRVKAVLRMALRRSRLPNSLLFSGPDGVGKLAAAVTVAKALNCRTRGDDACDACPSCRAIDEAFADPEKQGLAPDVMFVALAEAKQKIAIDQVRLLKQTAYLRPMAARARVFIVLDADLMSEDASHSILKVLEEPPPASYLILVTGRPHLILPTIRSRCRSLEFVPVAREEIARELTARGVPAERASLLALLANGSLEEALGRDWDEAVEERRKAWDQYRGLSGGEAGSGFLREYAFVTRAAAGDGLRRTLELFASFTRDALLLKEGGEERLLLNPDRGEELRELAARRSVGDLQAGLAAVDTALAGLGRNMNLNLLASAFYSTFGESPHV